MCVSQQAGVGYHVLAVPDLRSARLVASYGAPCFTMDDAEAYEQQLQEKKRERALAPVRRKGGCPTYTSWGKAVHVFWGGGGPSA